jgi:PAS domain-containing protein
MKDVVVSLGAVLDAMPVPVLVVDRDIRVLHANASARRWIDGKPEEYLEMRGGDVLRCLNASLAPDGCGTGEQCRECVLRRSVEEAAGGCRVVRHKARLDRVDWTGKQPLNVLVTASPVVEGQVLIVLEDVGELMELKSILPMCASCHRIRDDEEYWQSVESYFSTHLNVDYSHGLCPDCVTRLYPEFRR